METRVLADRMMEFSKVYSRNIAEQWYESIRCNRRTPFMQTLPKEKLVSKAVLFFEHLNTLYFSENPYEEMLNFMDSINYAEDSIKLHIPLNENIYSLIMMRRHVWLYAESQAIFSSPLDMYLALQSINRTILVFDYAIYILSEKYAKLQKQ
jgi:hypothetical protein